MKFGKRVGARTRSSRYFASNSGNEPVTTVQLHPGDRFRKRPACAILPRMKRDETITLDKFLSLLRSGNLLGADDLARVDRQTAGEGFQEPGVLAWWLVEQNLITRWQAHMLVSGWNHFFLDKYKLLDRVGAGGMGTVYKAWQPGLARAVALKVLSDALLENEQAVARFHREIQSVAALEHPNIVATFDADCVKGKHFLVMEYVEGQDLDAMARKRGRLPAGEACEYVRQAALGLAHAHERGMVHRDIKPANLLVTFRPVNDEGPPLSTSENRALSANGPASASEAVVPVVKILDFGLARFGAEIHGASELTQTGQIMGTPDYIAPEQARDTKSADHRSDIFSLGCTLFRLVTGQVPYRGNSVMEKLMARALDEAPRARSLCPELHPALDNCIARMLARDPASRYQTADELALVLNSFTSTLGLPAIPASATGDQTSFAAGLADPAGAGLSGRFGPLAAHDTEMAQFLAVLADEAKSDSSFVSEAAESTHVAIAAQAAGTTRFDKPRQQLSPVVRTPRAGTHRAKQASGRRRIVQTMALAFSAVVLVGLGGFILWQRSASTRLEIVWPDDERKGATLEVDGRERTPAGKLTISGSAGMRKLRLTRKGYQPIDEEITLGRGATVTFRPEWIPTPTTARRRELASLKAEVERIRSASGGSSPGSFPAAGDPSRAALQTRFDDFRRKWLTTPEAVQADSLFRSLPAPADQLNQATIPAYELRLSGRGRTGGNGAAGAPAELVAVIGDSRLKHSATIWSIAYSPDETLLAAADDLGYVKIWNPETGEEINSVKAHESAIYSLAFSPDGKTLLTGSVDELARLWNVATMQPQQTLSGHTSQIRAVAFGPQGDLVATAGLDQTIKLWDPAEGKLLRTIEGVSGFVSCVAFSPDGRMLAVGCHEPYNAYLFDVADGTLRHRLEGHLQVVYSLAFSPDGRTLVTGSADASIKFWNTLSGKETRSIQTSTNVGVAAVRFSPDGRTVAAGLGDGTVEFRETETGVSHKSLRADDAIVTTMALSHSGRRLTTAGGSQTIRIWDLENGTEAVSPARRILCLAASPDGRRLALGVRDGIIDLWDVAQGKAIGPLQGTTRRVASLAFSPDGAWLASAGEYGESTVRVWDVSALELLHVVNVQQGYVYSLAFSPDAGTFASGGDDGTVKIWNSQTAAPTATLEGKSGPARCLAFSRDGRMLAAGHIRRGPGGVVKIWDLVRARELKALDEQAGEVVNLSFGRDDKILTTGSPQYGVKLWDIARGFERMSFTGSGPFACSPDGSLLAVDEKPAIHVYDSAHSDRTAELSLGRPDLWATQLVFTADGRHLAALASNGTVHILRLPVPTD
jgi:WD40 repeat protein/serine/threonine protein kinase